jgi:dolichol-phosphate mannosyltransferase
VSPPSIRVLLPAFDEEQNLPPLLEDFRTTFATWPGRAPDWRVVVVDDGSRDETARAATSVEGVPVTLIRHGVNRGLGAAMRTGIEHVLATCRDDDLLVTMDADHTHPPELLPSMVALADAGADLVVASRYRDGSEIHGLVWWRRALSDAASLVFRALFPCGARDYTCGYRLYRVGLLRWGSAHYGPHFLNQRGFSVMVDLLLKLRRRARRIAEVPLVLRYDRKRGASKMKVARTAWTTLRLLGRRFLGDPTGP